MVQKALKKCADDTKWVMCIRAKHVRNAFNTEKIRATRPLEILLSDVCGKISPPTHDEKNYFLTIINNYTDFVTVYLMESKDEIEVCIQEFINTAKVQHNPKVFKLRYDNVLFVSTSQQLNAANK